ncbi:nuclear factor 7, ovary isoform X1 [Oreochromis niloticus]|uniref:nuclear factor 7, ovary isoform X1 n=1 Tax=Oreochromis niloticus TaxID=8128 RepID=UPI000905CFFE|nr:nuclear factor 7, ovary isoform X1 [Oreochromis niloticus]
MTAASYLLTEEQLLCCICLDVFRDPVTLPCGHNFCKHCITEHLNFNSQRKCPMCKEHVDRKYKLGVNTFISDMAVQFRKTVGKKAGDSDATPEKVFYNAPAAPKWTSLKIWLLMTLGLTCLTLFFVANLHFHQALSILKTHQLFNFMEKEEDRMCAEHDKPLEFYCKNEQMIICQSCVDTDHRFHQVVPLKEEYEAKKTQLGITEAKIQHMIQERQRKVQELKQSLKVSTEAADRETANGVRVFSALIKSLERAQAELIEMTEKNQKRTEKQTKVYIKELEQEVFELTRRRAEMEEISRSKDRLRFLQSFPSLNAAPPTKDWTDVSICPAKYEGITRTALVKAVDELTETIKNEMKMIRDAQFNNLRQNAADVTLDPDTAHPALILSNDGKQVHCGDEWKKLPDSSKRFEPAISVLGTQGFSCGRLYYDVQVKGKTGWTLGVAKGSVNRKGEIKLNPESGYWTICLRNRNEYFALAAHPVPLSVNDPPEKVRVFVDYEEGLVSFYDVNAAVLLHSYTGQIFNEKLYPFFSPGTSDSGTNTVPLIITPFKQQRLD